ncbi:Cobyric acid synthase [Paenibacillus plantiphilus]|uniref:Cobyric acid synthase n=1 Tax=Paenibacillus plantiphilus TaxID=2905650 RepID=A0ABM9BY53_9BACL|nr:cobyric acid synthase [Paenibacillus plantiphilus]CAH1197704.1 Cobyric acid synthase [Paenibacillus plantiphilus]
MSKITQRIARTIMVQGTASDVGKSILTAALCRILTEDGFRVAPFKSQNMSLNSYVTWDGKEIGRAQGLQADACGILATTDMNPILLKPKKDMVSQVVVHGKPLGDFAARVYREQVLGEAAVIVQEALARLRASFDIVVLEGAGSPVEINLKSRDIVNMNAAAWADAPVVLVADIDRGGMFASIVGTMELLEPHERDRVCGFIVNKFRGDVTLLKPGLDWLEERTGKPVLGVVPYLANLGLEDEDSLSLDASIASEAAGYGPVEGAGHEGHEGTLLDIVVLRLPHISNFTDVDPLRFEPDVRCRFVTNAEQWGKPDAVIIPGSKNAVDDLRYLQSSGLASCLERHVREGGHTVGICGGYEMMGARLLDPLHAESDQDETKGFGWFPFEVTFAAEKRTERIIGTAKLPGLAEAYAVEGYEIHMGEVVWIDHLIGDGASELPVAADDLIADADGARELPVGADDPVADAEGARGLHVGADDPAANADEASELLVATERPFTLRNARDENGGLAAESAASTPYQEGCVSADGRVWGTFMHGVLHNDDLRRGWLNRLRRDRGWEEATAGVRVQERREQAFQRLADHVRQHVNISFLKQVIDVEGRES